MKYFIVEQERYDNSTPMDSAKVGAEYLDKIVLVQVSFFENVVISGIGSNDFCYRFSMYIFYSASNFFFISYHSTSLDYFAIFILSLVTISFFFNKWSIISPILSARNGSDHEKRSRPLGKLNGCSTSLYYLMFILSFSIKITAPLFLYEPQ